MRDLELLSLPVGEWEGGGGREIAVVVGRLRGEEGASWARAVAVQGSVAYMP